jgi:hypothetical protein
LRWLGIPTIVGNIIIKPLYSHCWQSILEDCALRSHNSQPKKNKIARGYGRFPEGNIAPSGFEKCSGLIPQISQNHLLKS